MRAASLPHPRQLVDVVGESANLTVRTGRDARFIASVESAQTLRVTSREGMVFSAHRTSGGLLLLAELSADKLADAYAIAYDDHADNPDLGKLRAEPARIRRQGFARSWGSKRSATAGPSSMSLIASSIQRSPRFATSGSTAVVGPVGCTPSTNAR